MNKLRYKSSADETYLYTKVTNISIFSSSFLNHRFENIEPISYVRNLATYYLKIILPHPIMRMFGKNCFFFVFQNVDLKYKFWSKIIILIKHRNDGQKSNFSKL